ncbi:MAG: hypothetical protein WBA74_23440, partial [Cyclobacteriaceae bacterium]
MNKNEVIEKGLIEQYLLGEMTDSEKTELESLIYSDETLSAHLKQIENDLENLAFENAVTPPQEIRQAILNSVKTDRSNAREVVMAQYFSERKRNKRTMGIAAGFAVILASLALIAYLQLQETQKQLSVLENSYQLMESELSNLNKNLEDSRKTLE